MNIVPNNILELRPDTVQYVRKLFNFDNPESRKETIDILNEWIKKQSHFNKKDFSTYYLERTIILNKGSIERAKSQIDKICTMRTLLPKFFGDWNELVIKTEFANFFEACYTLMFPKLTEDHHRVYFCKLRSVSCKPSLYMDLFRINLMAAEYIKLHDYASGYVIVIDFSGVNLMDYIRKLNPMDLKDMATICIEGYGMRIKSIHFITQSKIIDKLVSIFKQVLSPKIGGRINVNKSMEELYTTIPKYILPKEYGGEERSLDIIQDEWVEALSSVEHLDFLRDMNTAFTDESRRPKDKFTELYAGMPGTFRYLRVD